MNAAFVRLANYRAHESPPIAEALSLFRHREGSKLADLLAVDLEAAASDNFTLLFGHPESPHELGQFIGSSGKNGAGIGVD